MDACLSLRLASMGAPSVVGRGVAQTHDVSLVSWRCWPGDFDAGYGQVWVALWPTICASGVPTSMALWVISILVTNPSTLSGWLAIL